LPGIGVVRLAPNFIAPILVEADDAVEKELCQSMNQPTAIHHLCEAGYEWPTIIKMIGLARQAQRAGEWNALDLEESLRDEIKEKFDRANVDPMVIDFT
jgi:hypothetical protein